MTASECLKGRRSIRQFAPTALEHSLISELVETASYAPSWKHVQIARYIAIEGEMKDKIADECTGDYSKNGDIIRNAPMLIAVSIITGRSGYERDGSFSTPRKEGWQNFDAGIAAQTFCLAAYEKGLGSVILGIFDSQKASALVALPEGREIVALIPIGYPAENPDAPKRKSVEELLTFL